MIESVSWGMWLPTESFPGRSVSHRPAWCLSTQRLTSCFTGRSRFFLLLFCSSTLFSCIFPYVSADHFFCMWGVRPYMKRKSNRNENRKLKKNTKKGKNSNPFPKHKETMKARPHFQTGTGRWKFCVEKSTVKLKFPVALQTLVVGQ